MRRGITLFEIGVVLVIVGVLCAMAVPDLLRLMDRTRVRHAANEIVTTLALARATAVAREVRVAARFDPVRSTVVVASGGDTIVARDLGAIYGISLQSNRDSVVYGPTGVGYGAANQTVVLRRGRAVDSLIISRLGRVRR